MIDTHHTNNAEFLKQQLGQAITTYRSGLTILVQILTIMVLANVSIWGYAINCKIAGIIYLGAPFPVLMIYLIKLVGRLLTPVIYTAYHVERELGKVGHEYLMRIGISVLSSDSVLQQLEQIPQLTSPTERVEKIRKLKFSILGRQRFVVYVAFAVLSVLQLLIPSYLYGWRIF